MKIVAHTTSGFPSFGFGNEGVVILTVLTEDAQGEHAAYEAAVRDCSLEKPILETFGDVVAMSGNKLRVSEAYPIFGEAAMPYRR